MTFVNFPLIEGFLCLVIYSTPLTGRAINLPIHDPFQLTRRNRRMKLTGWQVRSLFGRKRESRVWHYFG